MKNKVLLRILFFLLLISIMILLFNFYFIDKIKINYENIISIDIHILESDKDISVSTINNIKKVTKALNSINYYKFGDTELGSSSPDAWIIIKYKDKEDDKIHFYGWTAIHNSDSYTVNPFIYNKLKRISKIIE